MPQITSAQTEHFCQIVCDDCGAKAPEAKMLATSCGALDRAIEKGIDEAITAGFTHVILHITKSWYNLVPDFDKWLCKECVKKYPIGHFLNGGIDEAFYRSN